MAQISIEDYPIFGDEKDQDPQEFVYRFKGFLRFINLKVNSAANVEKAIFHLSMCMHKKARAWFENHVGPTPTDEDGRPKPRSVEQWDQILLDFVRAFHPLGKTNEQLEVAWSNLKWSPTVEDIEDYVEKIHQLAVLLGKSNEEQVIKIKMSVPDRETYMAIMSCTSVAEIITTINQLQAMSWLSPTVGISGQLFSAQHDDGKTVSFAKETNVLQNTPDWPERLGDTIVSKMNDEISKVNDKLSKLTHHIERSRDRYRDSDSRYKDRDRRHYSRHEYRDRDCDKCNHYKRRNDLCDGHKEERLQDCYEKGFVRHRYKSPCRYDARKSERHPQKCSDYDSEIQERMHAIADATYGAVQSFHNILNN